ncbi:MAG TPA: PIG-L family deacetylase [Thermoanaerobaculia bacterium]|nr:PIG-L family deacetylase [Thermoanaerobaculia bacterium]
MPPLPGQATEVHARRVLVLAPHYDDEVLGCGGLLAQLTAGGAQVAVLFLTDSAAEPPEGESATDYGARRHAEAEAAARVLNLASLRHLGLPDGRLSFHLDAAAAGVGEALLALRPELLLVPSPLEITADHRAAFAALHRLLAPLREEDRAANPAAWRLAEAVEHLRILAYEVNHPLHPNLLVDTSAQAARLAEAMACHRSQLARHPYLEARRGLSRWRALSLSPGVEAVEAYRELTAADFTSRSLSELVLWLGGVPEAVEVREGPLFSVVVRTRDRPRLLAEALASLAASWYRRLEVVLVNDGGTPPEVPAGFPFPVVRLDFPANRGRSAAAQAGVEAASGTHISFLDDDDLVYPEHFATLAGLVSAAGVRVAYVDAAVGVYELGAEGWTIAQRRLPYSRDFDPELLLLDNYVPFHTLAIERGLFAEVGPFDPELPFFEDWDFLIRLAAVTPFHHHRAVTCEYRQFRGAGHHVLGDEPRERGDFLTGKERVLAKHRERLTPARLARAIDRLRAEAVELDEARAAAGREVKQVVAEAALVSAERFQIEAKLFEKNGEVAALEEELARHARAFAEVSAEVERLHGEEGTLREDLTTQTDLVARLYAEVARLTAQIEAMEGSRAWRAHQWWQARRGRKGPS